MRRLLLFLAAIAALLLPAVPASAARPAGHGPTHIGCATPGPLSFTMTSTGPYQLGSATTYACTVPKLKGYEYPMVVVACYATSDGHELYGELSYPDSTFYLGGGSTWTAEGDQPADCTATLWVYPGPEQPPLAAVTFAAT